MAPRNYFENLRENFYAQLPEAAMSSGQTAYEAVHDPLAVLQGVAETVGHPIDTLNDVRQYVSNRYGNLPRSAETLRTDPLGVLGDASMAGMLKSFLKKGAKKGLSRPRSAMDMAGRGVPEDIFISPYPTSPNAYDEAMVLATNRTRPSPAPANYDYMGPSVPGPVSQRPMSDFDRASMGANWSGQGKGQYGRFVPGQQTGPGAVPLDYTLDELGQAVGPAMGRGMVPQRGGLPMMVQGEGIPYAEYRDVTGNVLRGPEGQGAIGYAPGMMSGAAQGGPIPMGANMATRMGEGAYRYEPSIASRMGYGAYQYEPVAAAPRGGIPMFAYPAVAAGVMGAKAYFDGGPVPSGAVGQPQLGPYDFGRMPGPQGMETMQGFRNYGPPMPQGGGSRQGGAKKAGGKPLPPRRPAELNQPQQRQFEGNFNYDVTRAIDALLGQNQAEAGRQYQEYYANNPWPY